LTVSDNKSAIKRVAPLPPTKLNETECTIYIEQLPPSATTESITAVFVREDMLLLFHYRRRCALRHVTFGLTVELVGCPSSHLSSYLESAAWSVVWVFGC
jgi:hypothetical protein